MYQTVGTTCCLRAVFVLTSNPTGNWTRNSKTQQDFGRCCERFTLNIFKSTLKNSKVFLKSVFKNSFLMKSLHPFL